jgi:hypothetical protein
LEDQAENSPQCASDFRLDQVLAKIDNEDGKASFQQALFSRPCQGTPEW